MHGRNRDEYKATYRNNETIQQKLATKSIAWYTLQKELLVRYETMKVITTTTTATSTTTTNNNNSSSINAVMNVSSDSNSKQNEFVIDGDSDGNITQPLSDNDDVQQQQRNDTAAVLATATVSSSNSSSENSKGSAMQQTAIITTTLELIEKAIMVNPDPIWLWNFRRLCIQQQIEQLQLQLQLLQVTTSSSSSAAAVLPSSTVISTFEALFHKEYTITQLGLQHNPKSYPVWQHRKWCIQQHIVVVVMMLLSFHTDTSITTTTTKDDNDSEDRKVQIVQYVQNSILQNEITLINILLSKDERNFHCWNYRRYIISCYLYIINHNNNKNNDIYFDWSKLHHPSTTNIIQQQLLPNGTWILPLPSIDEDNDDNNNDNNGSNNLISNPNNYKIQSNDLFTIVMGAQIITSTTTMIDGLHKHKQQQQQQVDGNDEQLNQIKENSINNNNDDNNYNMIKVLLQQEWDFTTTKIHDNFSNFSAFHYRSKLLPLIIQIQSSSMLNNKNKNNSNSNINENEYTNDDNLLCMQIIQKEFDLVINAIYTEPDDQTAWWYQVFLFNYILHSIIITENYNKKSNNKKKNVMPLLYDTTIIQSHIQQVRELYIETNATSKWVLIGLLQCLQYIDKYQYYYTTTINTVDGDHNNNMKKNYSTTIEERTTLLQQLIQIDPDRKQRYKYKLRQLLVQQRT